MRRSDDARQGIRAADYLSGSVCSVGARLSTMSPLAMALMSVRHDGSVVFGPVGGTVQKRAASALSACHSDGVSCSDFLTKVVFMLLAQAHFAVVGASHRDIGVDLVTARRFDFADVDLAVEANDD